VVKTHTIWLKPVYDRKLPEKTARLLVESYWRPYHRTLSELAGTGAAMGLDCHTMVETAPPIDPDPGTPRPKVCISNAFGTCPDSWLKDLGRAFESAFGAEVKINTPFKGGYIIRSHAKEMPWAQIEISRGGFMSEGEKAGRVMDAIRSWCGETF
jgi:N-formylglutamate amidohydrolase